MYERDYKEKEKVVELVDASGSGKSTFLNVCGGLDRPTFGEIYIEETDIGKLVSDERNLDSSSTEDAMGLLTSAVRDFGQTVIMITHNEALTKDCDRILNMKDGKLTER